MWRAFAHPCMGPGKSRRRWCRRLLEQQIRQWGVKLPSQRTPLALRLVSLFDRGRFSVPTFVPAGAPRAAAVKAGRCCVHAASSVVGGHALTAASTVRRWTVGTDGRAMGGTTLILDWAVKTHAESTASPCIRSGVRTRYPDLSCIGESWPSKDEDPSTRNGVINTKGGNGHMSVLDRRPSLHAAV
jgi:hypothetical protein